MEDEVESVFLCGTELFLFTDNEVAESCYYKGSSLSRILFELILRLHLVVHKAGIKLHVIHISGTRMIDQGTYGVSRGNFLEGVLAGLDTLKFVPLRQSALERSPGLISSINSWTLGEKVRVLTPEEWFER